MIQDSNINQSPNNQSQNRNPNYNQNSNYNANVRTNDLGPPSPTDLSPEQPTETGRRQRLFGFARNARDIYIPKLSGSVTQLAGVSVRAFRNDLYDENGNIRVPKDATISLYPTYTRHVDGKYMVDVGGWIACPGVMTRKNRLIISLVKQIIRYDSTSQQAIQNLESDNLKQDLLNDDDETIVSSDDVSLNSKERTPMGNFEETLKQRLSNFISRYIANGELTIIIGSEDVRNTKHLKSVQILSDSNGCFFQTVEVDYKPSIVQVMATKDETICSFEETHIVPDTGIAVISDIDDTVKLTGVIGDKRELLNNLLLKDISSWSIPSIIKWYGKLMDTKKLSFHYVSNSPVQLFPILLTYFRSVGLPMGSMHLKQYTGNIISSLMEPSSSRKKTSLTKLANDFSKKKFICVGDSGEYDFESYVELARTTGRVLAIYIRYVPNSLSIIDEFQVFNELNRILSERPVREDGPVVRRDPGSEPAPTIEQPKDIVDLIDLSDTPIEPIKNTPTEPIKNPTEPIKNIERRSKLPPLVPSKPKSLQGNQISKPPPLPSRQEVEEPPQLPSRPTLTIPSSSPIRTTRSPLRSPTRSPLRSPTRSPNLAAQVSQEELFHHLQDIYYSHHFEDLREIDPKGAAWIERVMTAVKDLENTNTIVRFFNDDEDLYEISLEVAEVASLLK